MRSIKPLAEQPIVIDTMTADQVLIKQIHIKQKDAIVPQHAHKWDHTSAIVAGAVRLWKDNVYQGEFTAPSLIFIEAGVKHTFQTLLPDTVLLCIHNGCRADVAAVLEEHQLEFS